MSSRSANSPRISNSTRVIGLLGYAGLIPFVVPALLVLGDFGHAGLWRSVAGAYAFGIIAFLTGSWWGMALAPATRSALLLSNIYFLLALICYLFAAQFWPLAAALLLLAIYVTEQHSSLLPDFAPAYRKLRGTLSLVSGCSMLALYLAA